MPWLRKPSPPLVSVITISYNHAKWLTETLESIRAQTLTDFELIYCDDASTDDSVATAERWLAATKTPARTILHTTNRGVCRTLNEALAICRGTYVQFVACDDLLLPEKLTLQTRIFADADPDVAVVHSPALLIDGEGRARPPFTFGDYYKFGFPPPEPLYETLLTGNRLAAMSALTRRDVIEEVGGFDESLRFEDWDMWLRIAKNYRFATTSEFTVQYRIHGDNLHLNIRESDESIYFTWRKHVHHPIARRQLVGWVRRRVETDTLTPRVAKDYQDLVAGGALADGVPLPTVPAEMLAAPPEPSTAPPEPSTAPSTAPSNGPSAEPPTWYRSFGSAIFDKVRRRSGPTATSSD